MSSVTARIMELRPETAMPGIGAIISTELFNDFKA
jgi:hypothetical protein